MATTSGTPVSSSPSCTATAASIRTRRRGSWCAPTGRSCGAMTRPRRRCTPRRSRPSRGWRSITLAIDPAAPTARRPADCATLRPQARRERLLRAADGGRRMTAVARARSGWTSARSPRAPCSWTWPPGARSPPPCRRSRTASSRRSLPDGGAPLPADWALQDPDDYVASMGADGARGAPDERRGPGRRGGRGHRLHGLHDAPDHRRRHAPVPAARAPRRSRMPGSSSGSITRHSPRRTASTPWPRTRGEPWLPRYGGRTSSEWFLAKSLQILDEAPGVYAAADRLIEAADWIVWQLTGVETRNSCTAGYKAQWSRREGFPSADVPGRARPALRGPRGQPDVAGRAGHRRACR